MSRDGEQAPGNAMRPEQKLELALAIEALNVDVIEAGFPSSSPSDYAATQLISQALTKAKFATLNRATREDIATAAEAGGVDNHHLQIMATGSDIHLKHKQGISRSAGLKEVVESARFARSLGFTDIRWALYPGGWIGHDGTLDGAVCHLRWLAQPATAVAFVANATSGSLLWESVGPGLTELSLPRGLAKPPDEPEREPTADLALYAGAYVNGRTYFQVRSDGDGRLRVTEAGGFSATLLVDSGDYCKVLRTDVTGPEHRGRFLRDAGGNVWALQLSGRIAKRVPDEC